MSLDLFMNDACPKCRKLIKMTAVEPHPTNHGLAVHKFECASCGPVTSKILYRLPLPEQSPSFLRQRGESAPPVNIFSSEPSALSV